MVQGGEKGTGGRETLVSNRDICSFPGDAGPGGIRSPKPAAAGGISMLGRPLAQALPPCPVAEGLGISV